jgi:hypothetical protein
MPPPATHAAGSRWSARLSIQHKPGQANRCEQLLIQIRLPDLVGDCLEGAAARLSRIVDEDVDAPETLYRLVVGAKEHLMEECNLHTIVRLPNSVFKPYASIGTNLLFFEKGEPTKDIWFWEHVVPAGQKAYSMTKPIRFEHMQSCIDWWGGRDRKGRDTGYGDSGSMKLPSSAWPSASLPVMRMT